MNKLKLMTIFGTRPEAIKMMPIIKYIEKENMIENIVCITAQHRQMLDSVLNLFNITPNYDLNIMKKNQTLSDITINILENLGKILKKEMPNLVLVHGDTTTTFASALACFYKKIKVAHIEAGLRTYNKYEPFPEEMNRKLTASLADLHFAPTKLSKQNLINEGIKKENIFITGNTAIDCLSFTLDNKYIFEENMLNKLDYKNKKIIVVTAHRRENIDKNLKNICEAINIIVEKNTNVEVVYLLHFNPNVREISNNILKSSKRIHLIDPINMKDMHNLIKKSYLVMTDSGGLQEEVPSMNKPVLVLRNVTERPEGVESGSLKLIGTDKEKIILFVNDILNNTKLYNNIIKCKNPFGDGNASKRIIEIIKYNFNMCKTLPEEYI